MGVFDEFNCIDTEVLCVSRDRHTESATNACTCALFRPYPFPDIQWLLHFLIYIRLFDDMKVMGLNMDTAI